MNATARIWLGLALAITAPAAGATEVSGATIARSVIGSGATAATANGRQLLGTVGQPVVGISSAATRATTHGYWTFGAPTTTAVDPGRDNSSPPTRIEFGAPSPNPSHGTLAFVVGLPKAGTVSLQVADVRGRILAPPASWSLAAGRHRVVFDPARDAELAAGIYFARLLVDGQVEGIRRFVRVR